MDGVLVVAKPAGPTSHDVVALVRRLAGTRRIGHGGTLDPFATGVLPLFLGAATKLVEYHLGDPKRYTATICFGATSTTDDLDGTLTPVDAPAPARREVERALSGFVGTIRQRPPAYSAIQVGGRRAYSLARAGDAPEIPEREVTIEELSVERWDESDRERPIAVVDVWCSAGTYVRALARDLGAVLGCGAYLGALARTASGPFGIDAAVTLEALRAAAASGPDGIRALLLPPDAGLDAIPAVRLSRDEVADARQGRFVRPVAGLVDVPGGEPLRLLGPDDRIVGIGRRDGHRIAPDKMFAGASEEGPREVMARD
jgi:tRNA pseudouridine55 synthase